MNKFPIDIFAVKQYGVEKWRKEFFWPVSDETFIKIEMDIKNMWVSIMDKYKQISTFLLIQNKLPLEYALFLHVLLVIKEVTSRGMQVLFTNESVLYRNLLQGSFNQDLVYSFILPNQNILRKFSSRVWRILLSGVLNSNPRLYCKVLGNNTHYKELGYISPLMKVYIKKLQKWVTITSQWEWFIKSNSVKLPEKLKDILEIASEDIIAKLQNISQKNNIELHHWHIDFLRKLTLRRLNLTAEMFLCAKEKIKRNSNIHLLLSILGNPIYRIISSAVRETGGKVTGFAHGNDVGARDTSLSSWIEFPFVDTFVTYTQKSAELMRLRKEKYSPPPDIELNIISADFNHYFQQWRLFKIQPLSKRVRNIMLIGFSMDPYRYSELPGGLALIRLDLELRLIETLKLGGYRVIYKVHPDRTHEAHGIFDKYADVVLTEYFERVLDRADAFLFGHVDTTTFGIALLTNKPVVVLNPETQKWFPEPFKLIKKRCHIIHTWFDERNRLIFDRDELLYALAKPPEEPNTEFVEKYMFP